MTLTVTLFVKVMGKYCTLNPQVLSESTGQITDSILFSDLKKTIGYDNARKVYLRVREEDFLDKYENNLEKDVNGEFTIKSLERVPELSRFLGVKKRKGYIAEQIGAYEPVTTTINSLKEIESKSIEYNAKPGNEFIALPEVYIDENGDEVVRMSLVKKTRDNVEAASRIKRKSILSQRLSSLMDGIGVDPYIIEAVLFSKHNVNSSDYNNAIAIAESILDLAKKAHGEDVVVSEFSNPGLMFYSATSSNPLWIRIANHIKNKNLAQTIFGEQEYEELLSSFGDDENGIYSAAALKVVQDFVVSGSLETIENSDEFRSLIPILKRMKTLFNDTFSSLDERIIMGYISEAEKSPLTRDAKENEQPDEIVFNMAVSDNEVKEQSKKIEAQRLLLKNLIDNTVRRYKILSSRDVEYDKDVDKSMIGVLNTMFQNKEYELGIMDFVEDSLNQLLIAQQQLEDINNNESLSIERRATLLKNVKDFIKSYEVSLKAITDAINNGVVNLNEETEKIVYDATRIVGQLIAAYERQKKPLLNAFVSRFIGEGLDVPFGEFMGKKAGERITPEEILEMADRDISVFDRWLDSMAESGDIMLRMLDQTAKQAKGAARLQTIEYKKRIDAIYLKLKKSGINDTSFMFKKDPNGHKTGEYISPKEAEKLDVARRTYYNEMMALKKELDAKLPKNSTKLFNIIRIRKDYIERLKSQDSVEGIIKQTKEALKDKVKRRSDNVETGGQNERHILKDFEGNQVETIPVMFVNSKDGENLDDISEDMTSAMLMYANMACNFSAMQNTVGLLEIVREAVKERPVQQRAGGNPMINVVEAFGIKVPSKYTKTGEATRLVQRMDDWFHSQVFQKYMADEGEILGMDVGMLANVSNEVTALNQFALNILSGISNVMTASAMNRIESICGQYFSVKNLATADKIFWSALPDYLGDVGNPVKSSKMALFLEKFNVLQDFESDVRGQEYGRSRMGRLMSTNSLYFINNAGELWIQSRAALALGESYGLTLNGKPIGLWESQEVVVDKNGVSRLVTRKGVKKSDGTDFTDRDVIKFTNKAKSLNQRMNGIYNYEDRNAAQAYAVGRMGLMFRKWIKPSLNRRYSHLNYNFDVEEWEEGFYRTTGRFLMQIYKDLRRGQLDVVASYNNLDPREKANLMRFATEVGQFLAVVSAFAVLKTVKKNKDDDDDSIANSWWFNQLLYQTRRLETEIGSQMIINPQIINEAINILKSPAACVNTWEGVLNMSKLLIPSNYTQILQTGRYKGHSKAYKYFWDSPIIPMQRTIYRGLHPENSLAFYEL